MTVSARASAVRPSAVGHTAREVGRPDQAQCQPAGERE